MRSIGRGRGVAGLGAERGRVDDQIEGVGGLGIDRLDGDARVVTTDPLGQSLHRGGSGVDQSDAGDPGTGQRGRDGRSDPAAAD